MDSKRFITKAFDTLGLVGILLLFILLYLNKFADEGAAITHYRFDILIAFLCCALIHYVYLATLTIQNKQVLWAIALFLAPVPVYWIYYGFYKFNIWKLKRSSPQVS